MSVATRSYLLGPLLKSVSRSFYLTLRILPAGMRAPVALAYLLARAADTIADTSIIPPNQRLAFLLSLRAQVRGERDEDALRRIADEVGRQQKDSSEKILLESLGAALIVLSELSESDRDAVREIVTTLTTGMEFDLRTFPDESSGKIAALREYAELDRYTYLVAGCVGEFWTRMTYAHLPGTLREPQQTMTDRGIRFGKALQLTNILRDCAKDLRIGRCYLPSILLERSKLTPQQLLLPESSRRARPILFELIATDLDHYRQAIDYTLALPRLSIRLRLACLWPILIGLETLRLLVRNEQWLEPGKASKIRRNDVYRIMARSACVASSNHSLRNWMERLMAEVEAAMQA